MNQIYTPQRITAYHIRQLSLPLVFNVGYSLNDPLGSLFSAMLNKQIILSVPYLNM